MGDAMAAGGDVEVQEERVANLGSLYIAGADNLGMGFVLIVLWRIQRTPI